MKLVDILARELKVWPEGYASLQQSFAGMVFHGAKDGILPIERLSVAEDFRTASVTRAQWQAAVDALKAERYIDWSQAPDGHDYCLSWPFGGDQFYRDAGDRFHRVGGSYALKSDIPSDAVITKRPQLEWTGEGLPPVGIEVEIHNKTGRGVVEGAESFIGTTCKVLATFVNMNGYEMVSVEDSVGTCRCFRADMCGPVRTPEQIAAEVRSKACDAIYGVLTGPTVERKGNTSDMAEALYDAGYRKFEIMEGE